MDLVILAADKNIRFGLEGLLRLPARLGVQGFAYKILVHPKRDPGVFRHCHEFLRSQQRLARRALVVFDRDGCGSRESRQRLEAEVEIRLSQNGWADRSAAVVIDPEVEIWAWGGYATVAEVLHWPGGEAGLRGWLQQRGHLQPGQLKPPQPKKALEEVLYSLRKPRSSSLYLDLATQLDPHGCSDQAFAKLRQTLSRWFT